MTAEKHLAAILAAWTDNPTACSGGDLLEALKAAEKDFDGVEADDFDLDFNKSVILIPDEGLYDAFTRNDDQTPLWLPPGMRVVTDEVNDG